MASFLSKLAGINEQGQPIKNINYRTEEESAAATVPGAAAAEPSQDKNWLAENYEGQLSVDVFSTPDEIIIKSTIAGVKPEDIDISINNDMLTIRGERTRETEEKVEDYYYQECYWGGFSRSIILPVEVDADNVSAALKNGVLTVRLPKARKAKSIAIKVKEE